MSQVGQQSSLLEEKARVTLQTALACLSDLQDECSTFPLSVVQLYHSVSEEGCDGHHCGSGNLGHPEDCIGSPRVTRVLSSTVL